MLVSLIVVAVIAIYVLGGSELFSLDSIKAHQAELLSFTHDHPISSVILFALVYITLTGISFPSAWTLSLLAGVLFGVTAGTIIALLSATIGCVIAFLSARYLLRARIERHYGNQLRQINLGILREGSYYLFALRLNPFVPFVIVNLVMGLTTLSVWKYAWVSFLAMIPGAFLYVNAGTQISRIEDGSDILSPIFILSSIALGLFPLLMKFIFKRRVQAQDLTLEKQHTKV